MADTKNSALTSLAPLDGTEKVYATRGATSGNIPVPDLQRWLAESKTLFASSADDTLLDLTSDGTAFSGSNGLTYNESGSVGITSYDIQIIGYTLSGDYRVAKCSNAVVYDPAGPSVTRLAADTFTNIAVTGGAGSWTITTVLHAATTQLYLSVVGAAGENTYWTARIVPLRLIL